MQPAIRPLKCVVVPDGSTLDVSAARELARTVLDGGRPGSCIVDLGHVRDLHDASLALLADLARAGVELLGLGEHHRRVLRYLLASGQRASTGT